MYVARMLSFEGTSFEVVKCPLNAQLEEVRGANKQYCDPPLEFHVNRATVLCTVLRVLD